MTETETSELGQRAAAGVEPGAAKMLTLKDAPVGAAAPVNGTFGFTDDESPPTQPPTAPGRLRNLGFGLLRALTGAAAVAGIAVVAIFSAEAAHDLCTRRPGAARDRPTAWTSTPSRWVTTTVPSG